jgi:hypothetical protein
MNLPGIVPVAVAAILVVVLTVVTERENGMSKLLDIGAALATAPSPHVEVLTAAELDLVGGGFDEEQAFGCTCGSRSICSTDGTDEGD